MDRLDILYQDFQPIYYSAIMKKIPLVLAVITGSFMALCIFQALTWPLKEIHGWKPEWWQIESLAEFGYWIATPSIYLLGLTSPFTKNNAFLQLMVILMPTILIAIAIVIGLYFLTRLALHLLQKKS
jgi:hypothetical protein